jgi:hypothetical protein
MELQLVKNKIHVIRGQRVMLDADLAELYEVETRTLKQAVKGNPDRFPTDFMFELTTKEMEILRSQTVTSSWGGLRYAPFAFTEQGVAMLSSVLKKSDSRKYCRNTCLCVGAPTFNRLQGLKITS